MTEPSLDETAFFFPPLTGRSGVFALINRVLDLADQAERIGYKHIVMPANLPFLDPSVYKPMPKEITMTACALGTVNRVRFLWSGQKVTAASTPGITDPEWRAKMHRSYTTHMLPLVRPSVLAQAQSFKQTHFAGKFAVGIHLRCPKHYRLEDEMGISDLVQAVVQEITPRLPDDGTEIVVFVATHLQDVLDQVTLAFPGRVVSVPQSLHEDGESDWTANSQSLDLEWSAVFLDALILSQCDLLIGGPSQVFAAGCYIQNRVDQEVYMPEFFPRVCR